MWDYDVIRGYNEFLLNMKNSTLDENFKNRCMAECRFLRALHYFNLAMRLGGVPIITEPQQIGDEDIYPSRNTEKEVYEFVRKELDEIIGILPPSYNAANKGRVSRFAALALKSRAMLYAGSIAATARWIWMAFWEYRLRMRIFTLRSLTKPPKEYWQKAGSVCLRNMMIRAKIINICF